jgi:hypothetical protein
MYRIINNSWMRSSRIWGIIKAEVWPNNTNRGLNNSDILPILREPNLIITFWFYTSFILPYKYCWNIWNNNNNLHNNAICYMASFCFGKWSDLIGCWRARILPYFPRAIRNFYCPVRKTITKAIKFNEISFFKLEIVKMSNEIAFWKRVLFNP